MTITYTAEVATSSFGCFLKLLVRWRGSIYKLLWRELLLFISAYYFLSLIYRFALNDPSRRVFEKVSRYCDMYNNLIPVAFVLGFYVSIVVSRWWDQFNKIPWPDRMALFVMANVHGLDERARLMRRTMMRYLCLGHVITLSSISPAVKKRFPTFQHLCDAGFLLPGELKIIEEIKTPHNKYFIPLVWTTTLIGRARKEGRIKDDFAVKTLIDEVNEFRGMLGSLFNYDWISVPLVYTQVVTLAVYMFFLSCLMGRQFIQEPNTQSLDMYVPFFTFLQFMFYMGWLKVAESLVNPFGEDDDDFDMNWVIDRNLQVSYLVVDEMHQELPELIKDQYWDETNFELPYTIAAEPFRNHQPHLGSAININIAPRLTDFVPLSSIVEDSEINYIKPSNNKAIPNSAFHGPPHMYDEAFKNSPTVSNRLLRFIQRSASRDSQATNIDSPQIRRAHRQESITTQNTSGPPSPGTTSMTQDEIFAMDLTDNDSRFADPSDFHSSQTSLNFFNNLRQKLESGFPAFHKEQRQARAAKMKAKKKSLEKDKQDKDVAGPSKSDDVSNKDEPSQSASDKDSTQPVASKEGEKISRESSKYSIRPGRLSGVQEMSLSETHDMNIPVSDTKRTFSNPSSVPSTPLSMRKNSQSTIQSSPTLTADDPFLASLPTAGSQTNLTNNKKMNLDKPATLKRSGKSSVSPSSPQVDEKVPLIKLRTGSGDNIEKLPNGPDGAQSEV